jgi:PPK2 family polyphosphate:nucleotide phosphotransferase
MADRSLRQRLLVRPGGSVDLGSFDPEETHGRTKDAAGEELATGLARLEALQERLWASASAPVLIVLQGIDTAGKDGTMRHVMSAFNPQGCRVVGFKVPTPVELAHDYLWRVHQQTPARGEIVIFNRSHYEDVLVVRVHELVGERVWRGRYREINDFERLLTDSGTTIIKLFLYISRDEQRRRLQARIDTPEKRWKFRRADLDEREHWDDYIAAYEEALERCSTETAPWYLIPSDNKWFRNLAVADVVADVLDDLELRLPEAEPGIEEIVVR